jgi:hypothetical protein
VSTEQGQLLLPGINWFQYSMISYPLLDVLIIKLFTAPCKFLDQPASAETKETMGSACLVSSKQHAAQFQDLLAIVPDMRTVFTKIAASTLEFLDHVSQVESVANGIRLLSKKRALLDSLQSWLVDFEFFQAQRRPRCPSLFQYLSCASFTWY